MTEFNLRDGTPPKDDRWIDQIRKTTADAVERRNREFAAKIERLKPMIDQLIKRAAEVGDYSVTVDIYVLGDNVGFSEPRAVSQLLETHYSDAGFVVGDSGGQYRRISWAPEESS